MEYILDNIDSNSNIKRALHFNDIYAIPMVNLDAYEILTDDWANRSDSYHKKNLDFHKASCSTKVDNGGISLYHNFPYQWLANSLTE